MDYKKIIRSRSARIKILSLLNWIPDKTMIRVQYWIKTGRKLNLNRPERYTEKLQWYKLYYRDRDMVTCADKYEVRHFVERRGYGHILNELYGLYEREEEVPFEKLPNQFVVKDTLGGGGDSVIICRDKEEMNRMKMKRTLAKWLNTPKTGGGREWVYYHGRKSRIIIERYLVSNSKKGGLIDYKFFCFYGKISCLYVVADRAVGGKARFGIYSPDFVKLPYDRADELPLVREIPKPDNYDEMCQCARDLAIGFPHVRVDLYSDGKRIIFGEMTFFDGSGYMTFEPDDFDFILGKEFHLPEKNN